MRTIKNKKTEKKVERPLINSIYTKEDITEILFIAEKFSFHVNEVEAKLTERIEKLEEEVFKI